MSLPTYESMTTLCTYDPGRPISLHQHICLLPNIQSGSTSDVASVKTCTQEVSASMRHLIASHDDDDAFHLTDTDTAVIKHSGSGRMPLFSLATKPDTIPVCFETPQVGAPTDAAPYDILRQRQSTSWPRRRRSLSETHKTWSNGWSRQLRASSRGSVDHAARLPLGVSIFETLRSTFYLCRTSFPRLDSHQALLRAYTHNIYTLCREPIHLQKDPVPIMIGPLLIECLLMRGKQMTVVQNLVVA